MGERDAPHRASTAHYEKYDFHALTGKALEELCGAAGDAVRTTIC